MAKITKEELIKYNTALESEVKMLKSEDLRLRETFCDLLDSVEFVQEYGFSQNRERKVVVQSWEGIAFMLGELKADAEFSLSLERERILRDEKGQLLNELSRLSNLKEEK